MTRKLERKIIAEILRRKVKARSWHHLVAINIITKACGLLPGSVLQEELKTKLEECKGL